MRVTRTSGSSSCRWDSDRVLPEWYLLLSQEPEEAEVQRFLELHPSMIPGGSGDIGPGGHHRSEMGAVFRRRPRLPAGFYVGHEIHQPSNADPR
jgi:hypothetical protein